MKTTHKIAVLLAASATLVLTAAVAAWAVGGGGDRVQGDAATAQAVMQAEVESLVAEKRRQRQLLEPTLRARQAYLAGEGRRAARQSTITACVNKKTKVMALKTACSGKETRVSWNAKGPAGPAGPTGAQGPAGATGAAGSNASVVFYEDIYGPYSVAAGGTSAGTNYCSAGGSAINGGFLPTGGNLGFALRANVQDATSADGWFSVIQNGSGSSGSVYINVYCAL